tara:strand:+ start:497 stop:1597 length:1101 start_codon:yes stop_codon:yes gene_type:complete
MLYLYKPYIPEAAHKEIIENLKKGNLVYGENCKEFEKRFGEYQDIKYSLAVSSGTAALHLALLALDISEGDIVFVPDFTWSSTVNVVELVGAKPIFIDVDLNNYCMDLLQLKKKIEINKEHKGKKLILPVHQHGYPMDMHALNKIAKKFDCLVIEDAACAVGSTLKEKKIGSFSDISCFSFHPRKILTTGEGGMVATNDSNLSKKIRRLLNHGYLADMKEYKFPGLNYRMTEMQAILGLYGLKDLDERILKRRNLKNKYYEALKDIEGLNFPLDNEGHNWQTFLITLNKKFNRNLILEKLNHAGINIVRGSRSLSSLEYFKKKYGENYEVPNSKYIDSQGISIPFCEAYSDSEVSLVAEALKKELI